MPLVQPTTPNMQSPIMSPVGPAPQPMPQNFGGSKFGDPTSLLKTIAIVILSLVSVAFIGLFIWALTQYFDEKTDVEERINVAVATAVDKQQSEDEKECNEKMKLDFLTFKGPSDYGDLTFKYPKTWSVYIASDPLKEDDFEAYFNPTQVESIESKNSIYALVVEIRNDSFESVVNEYQRAMDKKDSNLTVESITLASGTTANKYTGTIPGTDFSGYIVVFKIRDKTAIIRTDSIKHEKDYNKVLDSITFKS